MSSLFSHIMIPVDFTKKNDAALEVANRLAQQNHARVTLLHVIEAIDYIEDEDLADFYAKLEEASETKMRDLAGLFSAEDIEVQHRVVIGKRAMSIVTFSMERDEDLVVLSSHKAYLNEIPKGLGTLSHQVSILSQCPVLLVK